MKDPPALLSLLDSVNSLVSHCEKTSVVMQRPSPPSSPSVSSLADDEETDHEECGYDFEFIDHLIDEHKCPVCLHALKNAVQTTCGHRFCQKCLLNIFRYCILFHVASQLFGYQSAGRFDTKSLDTSRFSLGINSFALLIHTCRMRNIDAMSALTMI